MRVLVIGGTGRIGAATVERLRRNHEVVVASRSGDAQVDILDSRSIERMYDEVGAVDAVISTVGATPFPAFAQSTLADFQQGIANKLLGQIDLVLQGMTRVQDGGSFTLTSGVLARESIRGGAVSSTVNGALESFVLAAAAELPRNLRINAVSPTVVEEALDAYGTYFPGFAPVPVAEVARAFEKSVDGIHTGRVYELG